MSNKTIIRKTKSFGEIIDDIKEKTKQEGNINVVSVNKITEKELDNRIKKKVKIKNI